MAQLTDRWMILVAGPMRSGKSTLGGRIVERFGGVRVGFGDAVRHRAQRSACRRSVGCCSRSGRSGLLGIQEGCVMPCWRRR